MSDRDALQPDPLLAPEHVGLALGLLGSPPGPGDEGTFHLVDDVSDQVRDVERLPGRGADLREHDEAVPVFVRNRGEQEEVGEREIGEEPPRQREPLQVRKRIALHRGVDERELFEGRHLVPSVPGNHS